MKSAREHFFRSFLLRFESGILLFFASCLAGIITSPSIHCVLGGVDGEAKSLTCVHEVDLVRRLDLTLLAGALAQCAAELVGLVASPGDNVALVVCREDVIRTRAILLYFLERFDVHQCAKIGTAILGTLIVFSKSKDAIQRCFLR